MFADYDETYGNIDQYYDEVYTLFPEESKVAALLPIKPTSTTDTTNTGKQTISSPVALPKQSFEVLPNQLIDGMPIGSQPKYNMLYSKKPIEGMKNKLNEFCIDNTIIIIMFFILILFIINLSMKVSKLHFIVGHLMYEKHMACVNQKNN